MSEITHNPTDVRVALTALPLLNQLIKEGHVAIEDGELVIADHVCQDKRFEWLVPTCRIRSYQREQQ